MPKIITATEAAALIPSGSRVMFGGFLGCGSALDVIRAIDESDVENIEGVFDDGSKPNGPDGADYYGWARLIHSGKIKKYIGSHVGSNPEAGEKWAKGELTVDLLPQGSMAEMIRAGGMGIPGILTATGIGTLVEESPWVDRKMTIEGKDYLLMKPLPRGFCGDLRLSGGYKGQHLVQGHHPELCAADGNGGGHRHCGSREDRSARRDSTGGCGNPGHSGGLYRTAGGNRQWISREQRISLPAAALRN